ncbi:MAG TPA: hypothetical protein GX523_12605 [Desulfitobacterium dehalogenans]|uniref:Uncharacterized protein n=1 Tax=Desulfitobacterium dehalogenans TaxID=36854 RepID=A0A7C7D6M0_9FIRM|nr:hypothetical protein [Desulfitobacterium dehalogenans]
MKFELNDDKMYEFFDQLANQHTFSEPLERISRYLSSDKKVPIYDCNAEIDMGHSFRNLMLIYPELIAKEQVCAAENIQRILRRFICIDGMERLLATGYSDIEWNMFLEYDFAKERSRYYRDHFIHQFRNAFLGLSILSLEGFRRAVGDWFKAQDGPISQYLKDCLNENMEDAEETVLPIVCQSVFLGAIFHDLGYPLNYFSRISRQISRSLSHHNAIFRTYKSDFSSLHAKLASSLLFRTVKTEEIRKKYDNDDHGIFSAICFLLNFYDTGAIHKLPSKQQCIINLAALAIYDHTNKYTQTHRMTFNKSPISYLLRISDDLQEWSRFYASVDSNNNAMILPDELLSIYADDEGFVYKAVGQSHEIVSTDKPIFYKTTYLSYKKLNFIDACSNINLYEDTNGNTQFDIYYNLYAQIEIAAMNFGFATHRHGEFQNLSAIMKNQIYLPNVQLNYILSNNVFYLAHKLLVDFQHKLEEEDFVAFLLDNKHLPQQVDVDKMKRRVRESLKQIKKIKFKHKYIALLYFTEHKIPGRKSEGVYLTVEQHSEYCLQSQEYLKGNLGLLGLVNRLMEWYTEGNNM